GDSLAAMVSEEPFTARLKNVPAGYWSCMAVATDASGASAASPPVTVDVETTTLIKNPDAGKVKTGSRVRVVWTGLQGQVLAEEDLSHADVGRLPPPAGVRGLVIANLRGEDGTLLVRLRFVP
ncbi:MAG TPA: hypothetical protein VK465_16080, partial [Fibrobacteria bacterium]|nr:hypothetical protein [Fibrobacteria bacterium]